MKKGLRNLEEGVASTFLVLLSVVVATQVVSRFILRDPFVWAEELARLFFIWTVFAGAAVALKQNKHFAIDLFVVKLPRGAGRWVERFAVALVVACLLVLIWKGTAFTWQVRGTRTDILEISQAWTYAALPVSCLSMLVRALPLLRRPPSFPAEDPGV